MVSSGEFRRKFRQRVSVHVGVRTKKEPCDVDSFTKYIQYAARKTLPHQMLQKSFAFASAKTRSAHYPVSVARSACDFKEEDRLRKNLRRQLQQDHDNEWT
ncbi:hypothetical protein RB195_011566 [Necator americanus]|uniref:Uncharacterized protein n=1 Tax=Necator americanus TaxID=51031 RepID=A0ABR1D3Y0_NECAM